LIIGWLIELLLCLDLPVEVTFESLIIGAAYVKRVK